MRKGLISKGILVGFILSILMISGVFAKDVIEYTPAYGKVTFTHKKHVDLKIDCVKCHHNWKKGETSGKLCKECHKAQAEGKTILQRMPTITIGRDATMRLKRPESLQVHPGAHSAM